MPHAKWGSTTCPNVNALIWSVLLIGMGELVYPFTCLKKRLPYQEAVATPLYQTSPLRPSSRRPCTKLLHCAHHRDAPVPNFSTAPIIATPLYQISPLRPSSRRPCTKLLHCTHHRNAPVPNFSTAPIIATTPLNQTSPLRPSSRRLHTPLRPSSQHPCTPLRPSSPHTK